MTKNTDFKEVIYKGKYYNLSFEHIGEGHEGDFDEEDPTDEPLVRINLLNKKNQQIDDGSYCTQITTSVTKEQLDKIAERVFSMVSDTQSPKRIMEQVSWFGNDSGDM